jgi:formate dehydrogenase major subunit
VNPLRGQNNVQGACDMGALPNVLTGYQTVTDETILAKFQHGWGTGVRLSPRVGMAMTEMFPAVLEGKLKAMFIMGENPVISDANSSHVREALEKLDLLVVQDIFLTETAKLADVVLPAASFAEKDGTFTNTERRVQRVRKALNPPGNALADWEIITAIAQRVSVKLVERNSNGNGYLARPSSYGYWEYKSAEEIFDELAALTPSYAGISYARLERGGLQWPCPNKYHPGTPYLHQGRFARGLGKFHGITYTLPPELPDEEYPFYLSTGRIRYHYHTGSMTRRTRSMNRIAPEERIEMHPDDAGRMGIAEGDWVRVISRRGEVQARVRLTDRSAPGMVFGTFHFAETPINVLTNNALDPVGKIPEYKVSAVRVEKVSGPTQEGGDDNEQSQVEVEANVC